MNRGFISGDIKRRTTEKGWNESPQDYACALKTKFSGSITPFSNGHAANHSRLIVESRDHDNPISLCLEPVEISEKSSLTAANAKFHFLAPPKLACHRRLKRRRKKAKLSQLRNAQNLENQNAPKPAQDQCFKNPLPAKPSFPINMNFSSPKLSPQAQYHSGRDAMTKKVRQTNSPLRKKTNSIPLAHYVHNSPKKSKVKRDISKPASQDRLKQAVPETTETLDAALVLSSFLNQEEK